MERYVPYDNSELLRAEDGRIDLSLFAALKVVEADGRMYFDLGSTGQISSFDKALEPEMIVFNPKDIMRNGYAVAGINHDSPMFYGDDRDKYSNGNQD